MTQSLFKTRNKIFLTFPTIVIYVQEPLCPIVLGGDHSISYPVVRAISSKLGGPVDILHLDAHPDIYDAFEGNRYSHASSFARIMEGGYARRLLQVLTNSLFFRSFSCKE